MMNGNTRRPSGWLYLLAAAIITLGGTIFALLMSNEFRGMQRVLMPGTATVQVQHSGTQLIFYEYQGSLRGVHYDAPTTRPPLRLSVVNAETGKTVSTTTASSTTKYHVLSRSGVALARFEAPQAGTYRITAAYPNGGSGPQFALTVASGRFGGVMGSIAVAVVVLVISLLAGIALALYAFLGRHDLGWPSRRTPAATSV